MLTFLDIKKDITAGKPRNVYYIAALDNYFVSKAGEALREKLFGSKENRDNFFIKYADETPFQEIIDLNSNFSSLFSPIKIVIVKRCEKYSRKLPDLFEYFKKTDPDSYFLFVFEKDYVLEKKLDKEIDFYDFSELPQKAVKDFAKGEFQARGCSISDEELDFFIASVPQSFDLLVSEIEKISNYDFGSGEKIISKDIILEFTGYDKEYSPEELIYSIINKNSKRALGILDNLLNVSGLNEIYLLSIISNYYIDLISFKTRGLENAENNVIYGKYKMWGSRARFAKNYHKKINISSLENSIKKILETDQKLKTSMLDSKILMASLVEELVIS
jgi:DNA polymerase III delta subunit